MTSNIQVSTRDSAGRIFVVGGEDFNSFWANAVDILGPEKAQLLVEDFQLLTSPETAPAVAAAAPVRGGYQPAGAPVGPPPPGSPVCQHGPRQFKAGFTSKAGKEMPSSWQCTSRDRNDQCKAQWNDN